MLFKSHFSAESTCHVPAHADLLSARLGHQTRLRSTSAAPSAQTAPGSAGPRQGHDPEGGRTVSGRDPRPEAGPPLLGIPHSRPGGQGLGPLGVGVVGDALTLWTASG